MAHDSSRMQRCITYLLLALASIGVDLAVNDVQVIIIPMLLSTAWILMALFMNLILSTPVNPHKSPPFKAIIMVLVFFMAPFCLEPLCRKLFSIGYPLEVQMVFGLRNAGLALAACSGWLVCMRTAVAISFFLILFTAIMTDDQFVYIILVLYFLLACVWLALNSVIHIEVNQVDIINMRIEKKCNNKLLQFPWLTLLLLFMLCATPFLAFISPNRVVLHLGELISTSGGTGDTDPFARYGTGDGPNEIAGDRAHSAGIVDSNKLIEDNNSALIDAISDLYGPPHKPHENYEQMVAAGWMDVIQFHGKLPENLRPSRIFDTSRKGPQRDLNPQVHKARSLFEVEGRTPLHIRALVFDRFESGRWREARKPSAHMIDTDGNDWMYPSFYRSSDWYTATDSHRIKVASIKDNFLPTPSLLKRFRINKVNHPRYYDWIYDGVLSLARRQTVPSGIIIHTECHTINTQHLPETIFSWLPSKYVGNSDVVAHTFDIPSDIKKLAEEWAGNLSRGWPQIEAIISRLRNEYQLDMFSSPPSHHPHPVMWFLTESRRGPDYLFATSAALLLHELNYTTRFCIGYYASPSDYDPESDHTPVRMTNLHAWAEVRLRDGHWLVIEASPGYETLPPKLSLTERFFQTLLSCVLWIRYNSAFLITGLLISIIIFRKRCELLDMYVVFLWRICPGHDWRAVIRRTVLILERRARWIGIQRSPHLTRYSWLKHISLVGAKHDVDKFSIMVNWADYAPDVTPPWSKVDVLSTCRHIISDMSIRRWRYAIHSMSSKIGA
ncbi:MAG: transglutaminase-like domain-containing protein [Candidatus Bilamarchaeaceae archaeon]